MGKALTITWLTLFVGGLFALFPEYLKKVLDNRLYTLFAIIILFLLAFASYMKLTEK